MTTPTAAETKACCAAAYGSDVAALLLGDSYHPGGLALTRRLARGLGLARGARVLDVAAGPGATATVLAREFGLTVDGVDLSVANVSRASAVAAAAGLAGQVRFAVADAERLPFSDATFDAVVVECALCTFPDQHAATSEAARVLRSGGAFGLTDVVVDQDGLPAELTTLAAHIACIAGASPLPSYIDLVEATGLRVTRIKRHDDAIAAMVDQLEARLAVFRLTARTRAEDLGLDFSHASRMLSASRDAVTTGAVGYALLVAEKP